MSCDEAERVKMNWPEFCPFTARGFFMALDHPELGRVPTYGGPFDSYTVPVPDDDGELRCERYDHDAGDWVEGGEPTALRVVDDYGNWPDPFGRNR